jgi:iron complex outermembrane receptor protein
VYSGAINVDGRSYLVTPTDFAPSRGELTHLMQGLSIRSHGHEHWDWEVSASAYDYADGKRARMRCAWRYQAAVDSFSRTSPFNRARLRPGAQRKATRPGTDGAHAIDFGVQLNDYRLQTLVSDTPDWIGGAAASRFSAFRGRTELLGIYAQDSWHFASDWRATLGVRVERWQAEDGAISNATSTLTFAERNESYASPKAALAWQVTPEWVLKASVGRAVRLPTVSELYQGSIAIDVVVNNDPDLKPEKSWTGELTAERELGNGLLRATYFHEDSRDALYSQTNVTVIPNVTSIQNVDHIRTPGLEVAYQANSVFATNLDLTASLTYAHSRTVENANFPRVKEVATARA